MLLKNLKSSIFSSGKSGNLNLMESFKYDIDDLKLPDTLNLLPACPGSEKLFLGRFNKDNICSIVKKVGLLDCIEAKGFKDLILDIDVDVNRINYLKLYWGDRQPDRQLIDLRLSEKIFVPDKKFFIDKNEIPTYNMMFIEWLSAKNPLKQFDKDRPQLPGQTHPGLGALDKCFELLHLLARLVLKDGFMDIPDHMYGAIMYSRKYKFFDPVHEGILRGVERDLKNYNLSDISWGVITKTIIDEITGEPAVYAPSEQIYYVSQRMKEYFKSERYLKTCQKIFELKRYHFDYDEMLKRRVEILKSRKIEDL